MKGEFTVNIVISIVLILVLSVSAYFVYLATTAEAPNVVLVDGKLRPCIDKPNCVSSETTGEKYIEPITGDKPLAELWQDAQTAAVAQGGIVESSQPNHLWVTYQTKLFKFVDDLELRLDEEAGVIQVRSGSRSGHSDMGVNRKRIEAIRAAIK
ncbi:DUF1499 domain-containing protein [Leucothrix sargassi]|nr:DUF1499 domain-containing protein [Leucothrix sargassi]